MRRRIFNVASALSLLLCVATVVLADISFRRNWSYPFPVRGSEYELGLGAGRLRVGNKPQRLAEERERTEALANLRREFDYELDPVHVEFQRARYGTPEYRAVKGRLDRLRTDYDARRRQVESKPKPPFVEHSLPLWTVLAVSLLLPAVSLVVGVMRRPHVRQQVLTPMGLSTLLFMVLGLIVLTLWVRSYWGGDEWAFAGREITPPVKVWGRPPRWYSWRWVVMSKGQVQFIEKELPSPIRGIDQDALVYQSSEFEIPDSSKPFPGRLKAPVERRWALPGISSTTRPTNFNGLWSYVGYRSFVISLWVPCLICWLLSAVWARSILQRASQDGKRCRKCRYNLTANTSGVCPECGTLINISN